MGQSSFQIEVPRELRPLELPSGVNDRLQNLLDRQDRGEELTPDELREAEGLVDLAEFLTLLKLRSQNVARQTVS